MRAIRAPRLGVRGVLCSLLLFLLVITLGQAAFAEVARPPGTGTGPVVAHVQLIGGTGCQIRASGRTFTAAAGLPLLATDEMIVPVGEFLVVALGNGHIVRIDEDLTMRVSELVLLGAPPTRESLTAQIDRLLTKKERVLSERISGVQARRQGADELPVETRDPRKKSEPPVSARGLQIDRVDSAPRQPSKPAEPPPPPVEPSAPGSGLSPGPTIGAQPEANDKSDARVQLPKQEELRKCLQESLLPSISRVTAEVKLQAGRVVRVRLRGGLVTPACMSRLLLKQAVPGPQQTWLRSEIVLR